MAENMKKFTKKEMEFNRNDDKMRLRLSELQRTLDKIYLGGGQNKIDKHHSKGKLTARETAVGRRMFARFAPKRSPFHSPSQRQGRYNRLILPKSALKRLKVDRKLTREVRKEKKGGIV